MNDDAYWDELDAELEANIDAITSLAERLLKTQNAPSVLTQFFAWFSHRSQITISQNGGVTYPDWLNRLKRMSTSMKLKKLIRDGDKMAQAAAMISDLFDDLSYRGTEKDDVKKTLEILRLLEACQRE